MSNLNNKCSYKPDRAYRDQRGEE